MGGGSRENQQKYPLGFTIVEMVVSMVLFVIIVVLLISVVMYTQYAQRNAFYMDEANSIARSKMVELSLMSSASLTNGTTDFSSSSAMAKMPAGSTAKVIITTPGLASNSKQVDVEIKWMVGRALRIKSTSPHLLVQKG